MKLISDILPWKVTDISYRPYEHYWSFNPSIHFDGVTWRCLLRCSDYCMIDGRTVRSRKAARGEARTKNAMIILDPVTWKPVEIYKVREQDNLPRMPSSSIGYEDIRLFRTDKGGLQGIAAALHLKKEAFKPTVEQVLLTFDDRYRVIQAMPIRWEGNQKNWAPFDNSTEPHFLYSIDDGPLFNTQGPVDGQVFQGKGRVPEIRAPNKKARARARACLQESSSARPHKNLIPREIKGTPLRGGSQLLRVGENAWLGIGHSMQLIADRKFYWHVWYTVDSSGKLLAKSQPMKLVPNGIEFAAGLAIDGDRVVVSFGVDDAEAKLGETSLSAVLSILKGFSGR